MAKKKQAPPPPATPLVLKTDPVLIPVARLKEAPWNYKEAGSEEQLERLTASILRDRSPGVLAVRELEDGSLEVIDGNHRLKQLRAAGIKNVWCENFGAITQAEAVLIAYKRNREWFESDMEKLSGLYAKHITPGMTEEELRAVLPMNAEELRGFLAIPGMNWEAMSTSSTDKHTGNVQPPHAVLGFKMDKRLQALWRNWCAAAFKEYKKETNTECLAMLLSVVVRAVVLAARKKERSSVQEPSDARVPVRVS